MRGQDERVAVALFPQAVDHRRHQAQHAAGALKFHQRGPVGVEPVEDLRMDGIRRLDAFFVIAVAALGRELRLIGPVEIRECARHHVAVLELRCIGHRLEQAPPHNLEALLGTGRPPGRFHPANDVAQPLKRLASALAADLHIVRLRMRGARCVRGRQTDHQHAVFGQLGRLGQHLREGELRLEAPRRQIALVVELARVGDPLVDQDQARRVLVE